MRNIQNTVFNNARLQELGIEPIDFASLRDKLPQNPERVEFFMLLLVTAGEGKHRVDFVDYPLEVGSLMFVRPGQVQEWCDFRHIQAEVILIDPTSLPHDEMLRSKYLDSLSITEWPNCSGLPAPVTQDLLHSLVRLRQDFSDFDGSEIDIALIRHELLGLLLRLARWLLKNVDEDKPDSRSIKTYRLFQTLLEQQYKNQHQLKYYAQRIGYAESTISRACIRAQGDSAKVVIDKRIVLEAKRMLVHSQASVAEIGFYLGFSEATNFIKFFKRMEFTTPQHFREARRLNRSVRLPEG
ncbi:MAG: helix-turn-helix domain-containing protein [Neptuniibacter sp.]